MVHVNRVMRKALSHARIGYRHFKRALLAQLDRSGKRVLDANTFALLRELRELANSAMVKEKKPILLFSGYYFSPAHILIDSVLALSLRIRGNPVVGIIGSNFFRRECVYFGGRYGAWRRLQVWRTTRVERLVWKRIIRQPFLEISDFSADSDLLLAGSAFNDVRTIWELAAIRWKDLSVGRYALNAVANLTDTNEPSDSRANRASMRYHIINMIRYASACERILACTDPDIIVMNSPFYYRWGIPFDMSRSSGIHVYTYMLSTRRDSVFFSRDERTLQKIDGATSLEQFWHSIQPKDSEVAVAIEAFASGQGAYTAEFGLTAPSGQHSCTQRLSVPRDERYEILIPLNVPSDAACLQGSPFFSSLNDFIASTVDFARLHPDMDFTFKVHPAEKYYGERLAGHSTHDLLRKCGADQLPNVRILSSKDDTSISELLAKCRVVCLYTSTVALEAAVQGIPVIQCGFSGVSELDFIYTPTTHAEFYRLLEQKARFGVDSAESLRIKTQARRYVYVYERHAQVRFEFMELSDLLGRGRFKFGSSAQDVLASPQLSYLIDRMELRAPIFADGNGPPASMD